jgi:hypothetical protein
MTEKKYDIIKCIKANAVIELEVQSTTYRPVRNIDYYETSFLRLAQIVHGYLDLPESPTASCETRESSHRMPSSLNSRLMSLRSASERVRPGARVNERRRRRAVDAAGINEKHFRFAEVKHLSGDVKIAISRRQMINHVLYLDDTCFTSYTVETICIDRHSLLRAASLCTASTSE